MTKFIRFSTWFLGISLFMFGILKFAHPFKGWYTVQIQNSGLPFENFSFWAGQLGEIFTGILFLYLALQKKVLDPNRYSRLLRIACLLTVAMMSVAVYVHLQMEVPSDVLPMKIRAPFVPGVFLVMACLTGIADVRKSV